MPSAAAKKKRAAQRAAPQLKVSKDTGCQRNETQLLDDDIAALNVRQDQINADRERIQKRITAHSVKHNLDKHTHSQAAEMSEREVQHSQAAEMSEPEVRQKCHDDVAESRPAGAHIGDRSSDGGKGTESCRRQATNNPMTLLQSTYPQRVKLASSKAVEELLGLLHLYEPPSDPTERKHFESQIYAKVKRIMRYQQQRAYRKAKKMGLV